MQPRTSWPVSAARVTAAYDLVARRELMQAERLCREALASCGNADPAAWTALGVVLREMKRFSESESAYRRALQVAPAHVPARHNLGALLSSLERAEEALLELDRAAASGLNAPELHVNRGRVLAQLYRFEDAERAYTEAVTLEPRNSTAQSSLAQLRHMRGDPRFARSLAAAARVHPGDITLQLSYGEILQLCGDLAGSESVLRALVARVGPLPEVRAALAVVLQEMGRLKEAEAEALEAAIQRPHNPTIVATLVAIELARGDPAAALQFIQVQRQRQPWAPRWIAHEAIALRLLQHPRYRELYDYSRFVRVYELQAPPGWTSMQELNAAVIEALRVRHRFVGHPLDQSLRNGSQSARSLLTDADRAIQGLIAAFELPIAEYRRTLGAGAEHPLSARNKGAVALSGCWSVELKRQGYHVNHIHPQGWLSSAYYVSVPAEASDAKLKSGWIKFGEPRVPVPGVRAEHAVEPRAGRLVLFPSYMWHGTNAIQGDEPRLTVAFDAVPVDAAPG